MSSDMQFVFRAKHIKLTFITEEQFCPVFIGPDNVRVCKSLATFLVLLADEKFGWFITG